MGANNSLNRQGKNKVKKIIPKKDNAQLNDDEVFHKINNIASELRESYQQNFLKQDFCDELVVVYENKLANLNLRTLKNVNKQLNSESNDDKLETFLQYKTADNEKFIVNELKGELKDYFRDKDYNLGYPELGWGDNKVPYINEATLDRLNLMRGGTFNTEMEVDHIIKNKSTINNDQKKNVKTNNKLSKMLNELDENLSTKSANQSNTKNFKFNNSVLTKKHEKIKHDNKEVKELTQQINRLEKNFTDTEDNISLVNEPIKEDIAEIVDASIDKNFSNRLDKNVTNQKTDDETPINHEVEDILDTFNKNQIKINSSSNANSFSTKKYCESKDQDCKLTKNEICKAIAEHYIVRSNIIAAILTMIPKKNAEGKLTGSFCYDRYEALRDAKICLPPDYTTLNKLSPKERVMKLLLFINKLGEADCNNARGFFKVLSKKEKDALGSKYDRFNSVYLKFTAKLKKEYLENAVQLLNIVEHLKSDKIINNNSLNQIADQTKNIIDTMYTLCQKHYLNATLALLKADLESTQETLQAEEKLYNYLETQLS